MKSINKLSEKLENISNSIINNVVKAQRETAYIVCDDVKTLGRNKGWKDYPESIKVGETKIEGNKITTEIYTDAKVISSKGKEYNLGYLLETGTSPHIIEPVDAKSLHFQINGEDIFTKRVNHPGTVAQPHFSTGLEMNKLVYKQKLNEVIRRSFK